MILKQSKRFLTVIGLSGGIASGKSKVGELLEKKSGLLIDADKIGHKVIQLGPVKKILRSWLGSGVFDADGSVDHDKLAAAVFGSVKNVRRMNKIVHPLIKKEIVNIIARSKSGNPGRKKFIILDAALLMEAGLDAVCDTLIFVEAPKDIRRMRVSESRGWNKGELARRERFQMSLKLKEGKSNFVIHNNGSLKDLFCQVNEIYKFINALSN
ncbi:MAG: dephospho-CoA kinase [Candidatus Brocadiia bacterium]